MNAKDLQIEETQRMMQLEEAQVKVAQYRTIVEAQEKLIVEYRELVAILKRSLSAGNHPS